MARDDAPYKLAKDEEELLNNLLYEEVWSGGYCDLFKNSYKHWREKCKLFDTLSKTEKEARLKKIFAALNKEHEIVNAYFSPRDSDKAQRTDDLKKFFDPLTTELQKEANEKVEERKRLYNLRHHIPLAQFDTVEDELKHLKEHEIEVASEFQDTVEHAEVAQDAGETIAAAGDLATSAIQTGRSALPTDLTHGIHAATIATSAINFVMIPILYLSAKIQGKPVPFTASNNATWAASAVFLTLAIVGVAVPPLGLIMLTVSGAVSTVVAIGSLVSAFREARKNERTLNILAKEIKNDIKIKIKLQKEVEEYRKTIDTLFAQGKTNNDPELIKAHETLYKANKNFDALNKKIHSNVRLLKSLESNKEWMAKKADVVPRVISLGLAIGGVIATALLFTPAAPIAGAIFVGLGIAGLALMGNYMREYIVTHRANKADKKKIAEKSEEAKQEEYQLRETSTLNLYNKMMPGKNDPNKTHEARVKEIALRLQDILDTKNHTSENDKNLVEFFVNFTRVHRDDTPEKGQPKPIFDELPKALSNKAFIQLQRIIEISANSSNGALSKSDKAELIIFDKKFNHFFGSHGVDLFPATSTASTKSQPAPNASNQPQP